MTAAGLLEHRRHNTRAESTNMRFWARAIGDRNPRYVDEAYDSPHGGGFEAHPCWLYSVQDTVVSAKSTAVPVIAGTEWTFRRPVVLGDQVRTVARLLDERQVKSRFAGPTTVQRVAVVYTDARGEELARAVSTLFLVQPEQARQRGKYADWKRWRYTPQQLEAIEAAQDAEDAVGSALRYADDLRAGDELPVIARGPLTSEEISFFVGATSPIPSQEQFAYDLKAGRTAAFQHPRTGVLETYSVGVVDDEGAQQLGFPAAHDPGTDRISYLASLVTNWMGPAGHLTSLAVRLETPHMLGDTSWCHGRVTDVQPSDGATTTVRVELRVVNQAEQVTATGTATVSLPCRGPVHG